LKYINFNGELLRNEEARARTINAIKSPLFETILIEQQEAQLAELHWDRLSRGLAYFAATLPAGYDCAWLKKQAIATAMANGMAGLCRLRLSIYTMAGAGASRLIFYLETFALEPAAIAFNDLGLRLGIAENVAKRAAGFGNLKTWEPMLYETAIDQCNARGLDDLLVKNTLGNVVESTIANLFLVSENKVYTPPLGDGCVEGVMRRFVIESLAAKGISVQEKSVTVDDLFKADELFLTNAIRRIKWVASLDDCVYTNVYTNRLCDMLFGKAA